MLDALTTWLSMHTDLVIIVGIAAFAMLVATLLATPWALGQLPHDYFSAQPSSRPHSLRSTFISIVRTIFGVLMILLGIAVILTPVPGVVLMVLGLALCDIPGKHNLLVKLVRQPNVFSVLNWIRGKSNKPPFIAPPIS